MTPLGAFTSIKFLQLLILLSGSVPALCQSITSSSTSTACTVHCSSTALPIPKLDPEYSEYTFTYPPSLSNRTQDIKLSYKDTINVTWTLVSPHHNASLSIACWNRNKTTSPKYDRLVPDLDHTVFPPSSPNVTFNNNGTSSAITSLLAYKDYNPCQFGLVDLENPGYTNGNEVVSGVFEISDEEGGRGGTLWSAQNPAPVGQQFSKEGMTISSTAARVLFDGGATALWLSLLAGTTLLMAWT